MLTCSTALFINYLPTPLVLLTDKSGKQSVHIAYEAYSVASTTFPADQLKVWEDALPWGISLKSVSAVRD